MNLQHAPNIKIGVFGDPHLTTQLPYTVAGSSFRKDQLISFLEHSFKTMIKVKVDLILVLGDLCHKTVLVPDDLDLLMCFLELSRVSEIPTVIINGNHDLDYDESILKFLDRFKENCDNIFFENHSYSAKYSFPKFSTEILAINYCEDERFLNIASDNAVKVKSKLKILIGHVGIKGTLHGTTTSIRGVKKEDVEKLSKGYDLMLFGHHHNFQVICENGLYSGSLHQVRIDERHTVPGSLIMFPKKGAWKVRRIENNFSPKFHIIKDYVLDPKDIEDNIVKVEIDTQNHSEKENRKFVKKIQEMNPYYLIVPKFKKQFSFKTLKGKTLKDKDKLAVLRKVISKMNGKKYENHIIQLYEKVKNE